MNENDLEGLFKPLSWVDHFLIAVGAATPAIAVGAVLVFLVSVALLAFRTREPGRFEIFLGAVLFSVQFGYYLYFPFGQLASSLSHLSAQRFAAIVPLLLVSVGFGRLTHAAVSRHQASSG